MKNNNMAALAKGAAMVALAFVLLVAGVSSLFHIPEHREKPPAPPPGGVTGESAPAPKTAPQAAAPGAPAPQGSAGAGPQASTSAAPPASTGASSQGSAAAPPQGAPAGGATAAGGSPGATTPPDTSAAPRKATDFSFPQAPWEKLLAQSANAPANAALPNAGNPPAGVAACASCHGAQGVPAAGTVFPTLAGAPPAYIAKQLLDYRDGRRQHPIMTGIAKGLSDEDIATVARYYGSLPAPAIHPPAPNPSDRAQRLHGFGDNGLALAACANCHGANGEGESPMLPRLSGQPEAYITGQLDAFRNGQRANDDVGTMRDIARRLSPEDSAALAKYYAGMRGQ